MTHLFHGLLGLAFGLVGAWAAALVCEARRRGEAAISRHRWCTRLQIVALAALAAAALAMLGAAGDAPVARLALLALPACAVLLWASAAMRRAPFARPRP